MSNRVSHHDHFEDALEMDDCRMANQFAHEGKLVCVGVMGKRREKK